MSPLRWESVREELLPPPSLRHNDLTYGLDNLIEAGHRGSGQVRSKSEEESEENSTTSPDNSLRKRSCVVYSLAISPISTWAL